jgi:hypothetical protein
MQVKLSPHEQFDQRHPHPNLYRKRERAHFPALFAVFSDFRGRGMTWQPDSQRFKSTVAAGEQNGSVAGLAGAPSGGACRLRALPPSIPLPASLGGSAGVQPTERSKPSPPTAAVSYSGPTMLL